MNLQEKYHEYQQVISGLKENHGDQKLFKKINLILNDRQLVSCMNDSKWFKLLQAIESLNFPPAFIVKCLTEEKDVLSENNLMNGIPSYLGNWQPFYKEAMPMFINIEYLLVKPLLAKFQGHLIKDLILDESTVFRAILTDLKLNFDEVGSCFKVFGYKSN